MAAGRRATVTNKKDHEEEKEGENEIPQTIEEDEPEQDHDIYEEVVLNYDEERKKLFKHIMSFIDDFSGHGNTQVFMLMLKNMGALSQLFGVEATESKLIPQCTSGFNH